MDEQIIVSLTTWSARIRNIPAVLDSIYSQSLLPDKVVLNLAYDEVVPDEVQAYIVAHKIEVHRTKDTKVYKKLFPTLIRYPQACVINIDDDFIYPSGMIEDFMKIHAKYPNNPISGNKYVMYGLTCHYGCASLSKLEHYGGYLDFVDDDLMKECPCDDIACTYFASKSGHPHVVTDGLYDTNMESYNETEPYSPPNDDRIEKSYAYLVNRFGEININNLLNGYIDNRYVSDILSNMYDEIKKEQYDIVRFRTEVSIRNSKAYRLGKLLLKPLKIFKKK